VIVKRVVLDNDIDINPPANLKRLTKLQHKFMFSRSCRIYFDQFNNYNPVCLPKMNLKCERFQEWFWNFCDVRILCDIEFALQECLSDVGWKDNNWKWRCSEIPFAIHRLIGRNNFFSVVRTMCGIAESFWQIRLWKVFLPFVDQHQSIKLMNGLEPNTGRTVWD